ncbi:glycyl-radical enzyme activating protein [Phocaeicola abscessus]|uniref:glycyl-radical enzyme activating protein n=1 Tax=Phocaeicola abscessus TaxID=555313 RepID=UPI0005637904|nr:glycyl-radical enzyme activating protein [Phocaeicola abscessus]
MALIFDIKRYAIHDGPGIRTTIFIKGCPLRCIWCHNPESWSSEAQKLYRQSKCIGCGTCMQVCPMHALRLTPEGIRPVEGKCLSCGLCTEECPTKALEMCGREWAMDELMMEIEKERDVMEDSHGGVTLCGGEPLFYPDYALELLQELGRRGFHRTVDTTLFVDPGDLRKVTAECELFLVDLKVMDSAKHRFFTGVSNERILRNIRMLAEIGRDFLIRIPLIHGVNSDERNIEDTAAFLEELPWKRRTLNLLPYHEVGQDKHRRMWMTYNPRHDAMSTPSEAEQERCVRQFAAHGLTAVIGG